MLCLLRCEIWTKLLFAALLALMLGGMLGGGAAARDHHVAPSGAAPNGAGAEGAWPSVQAALASGQVQGGDRILLAPGFHGALSLRNVEFSPALTIAGAGPGARVSMISLRHSAGLVIEDLQVWPDAPPEGKAVLVQTNKASENIRFARLDIRSSPKAERYMTWSQRDWKTTWNAQGARLAGPDITLRDSTLTAVSHGISAEGARARIIGNEIRGFSGDGIRGLSTGGLYQSNLIRDCVKVDGNHDDGFQAWVAEPGRWGPRALRNVRFEGNRIFEWTGPRDHTFRCSLQGIALFRGPFDNWTIANNLVVVSAYHGLTLYGGRKCKVVNNTVISADLRGGRSPWIRQGGLRADVPRDPNFQLAPGDRSQDNLFANNVATALRLGEGVRNPLALNTVSKQPLRDFEDPANFDFRPRADSRLLGAADPRFAPARDLFGTKRPQGGGPDLGAVER